MHGEIVFEKLCADVLDALRELGLGKFSIRNYYYEGMWPFIKVYRSAGVIFYEPSFTNDLVMHFGEEHKKGHVTDRIWTKVRKVAVLFEEYLHTGNVVWQRIKPPAKILLTPYYKNVLCGFRKYEESTRNICSARIQDEENICRKFFAYLDANGYDDCYSIDLKVVTAFLVHIAPQHKASMDNVSRTLKHLSNHLVSVGLCEDFSAALTARPAPRKKFRPAFSNKEVSSIMDEAARHPTTALRDTAMFSIASSLGMRAGDIVRLALTDIDWTHCEIHFKQNKTGVDLRLPLEAYVGNAIANYILHERPKTSTQTLFLRARMPFSAMTATAAGDRLRKYMKLSGIAHTPGDGKGFHSFRRYVASAMINHEVPVDTVREILGHTQMGSMKAYMRISHEKLALCALDLDGIEVGREELL